MDPGSADDGPLTTLGSCSASAITFSAGAATAALYGRLLAPPPPAHGG
ncbi:hypothetical protein [Geodermatophilus obscurus]|nr:hypothetical protein [Geodermatophilus obscurus]